MVVVVVVVSMMMMMIGVRKAAGSGGRSWPVLEAEVNGRSLWGFRSGLVILHSNNKRLDNQHINVSGRQ